MSNDKILSAITIYPVKSLGGIDLPCVAIGNLGPKNDRRWMVVDEFGHFMTLRKKPEMVLIRTALDDEKLTLSCDGMEPLDVLFNTQGDSIQVKVWQDIFEAIDTGDISALWLRAVLGCSCRLVYMPECIRKVNADYRTSENDYVSFADAYPVLLTTDGSLNDCNKRLEMPVPMNRFRPNLVLSGCQPFEEDSWKTIRIGDVIFECVKPCSRCVAINVDHKTGSFGQEPLKTLTTYRKVDNKIYFGQNLIHKNHGNIAIGQKVEVLEYKK